ncbi:hypothetical protein [Blastococcus sp. SYSU DS1024]
MAEPDSTPPDQLPATIRGHLAAHDARDVDSALPASSPTAVVVDDGTTYRGTEEIRGFLSRAGAGATYASTLVGAERAGAAHRSPPRTWRATSPVASSTSATASWWTATSSRSW